jgi:hypothetical protein
MEPDEQVQRSKKRKLEALEDFKYIDREKGKRKKYN